MGEFVSDGEALTNESMTGVDGDAPVVPFPMADTREAAERVRAVNLDAG